VRWERLFTQNSLIRHPDKLYRDSGLTLKAATFSARIRRNQVEGLDPDFAIVCGFILPKNEISACPKFMIFMKLQSLLVG
jgi:hypothetical protein